MVVTAPVFHLEISALKAVAPSNTAGENKVWLTQPKKKEGSNGVRKRGGERKNRWRELTVMHLGYPGHVPGGYVGIKSSLVFKEI